MICTTVRNGQDCPMMKKSGCSYTGGRCREAVEACKGCSLLIEYESGMYCSAAPDPALKWKSGICNMATHVKAETVAPQAKINPLKASKRASRKR
ncbi:MAG: PxxKW family cysteine-rich protein [Desulfococcaceae bacterium]|nr:PxxKW family cysteine-rich protein [Desulfococcaceae bacterium]